jgi:cytochrome bd-type quinol oxidase subunit 2
VVLTIAFAFLTMAVSFALLVIPILTPGRQEDLFTLMRLAAIGLIGVLAGILIIWSTRHEGAKAFAMGLAGLMFALTYLVVLYPVFLGVGHYYGPLALALIALAIWNLLEVTLRREA